MSQAGAGQDGSEQSAQRTVEGAQKFLSEYYAAHPSNAYAKVFTTGSGWFADYASLTHGAADTLQPARAGIAAFDPAGRCKSTIALSNLRHTRDIQGQTLGDLFAPGPAVNATVDWSKVVRDIKVGPEMVHNASGTAEVATGEYYVIFGPQGWISSIKLFHNSEEDAKRIAFAMQFLVDQCGFKSDTGF